MRNVDHPRDLRAQLLLTDRMRNAMSLFHWLEPASSESSNEEAALKVADKHVTQVVEEELALTKQGRKRKSCERHHYTDDFHTAIGKHAMRYGNKSTVAKFRESHGFCTSEVTTSEHWKGK